MQSEWLGCRNYSSNNQQWRVFFFDRILPMESERYHKFQNDRNQYLKKKNYLPEKISQNLRCPELQHLVSSHTQWRIQKILVGGDFKHKTSKIRMSSPKLRVIFRPKSEIQTFFSPKIRWSPKKKKKKVFTKIETDFSAEFGNSNVFFAQNQVVSIKKKKKKVFTKIESDFSAGFVTFSQVGGMHPELEPNYSK